MALFYLIIKYKIFTMTTKKRKSVNHYNKRSVTTTISRTLMLRFEKEKKYYNLHHKNMINTAKFTKRNTNFKEKFDLYILSPWKNPRCSIGIDDLYCLHEVMDFKLAEKYCYCV